uniref:Uncharacterized protein n=1 Tax=Micrurus surinamensis TaxID=129470 RepID=A0A2D4NTG5_MICSU
MICGQHDQHDYCNLWLIYHFKRQKKQKPVHLKNKRYKRCLILPTLYLYGTAKGSRTSQMLLYLDNSQTGTFHSVSWKDRLAKSCICLFISLLQEFSQVR